MIAHPRQRPAAPPRQALRPPAHASIPATTGPAGSPWA